MLRAHRLDLAIIGSGPAGLAAAVKAKQAGIRDLVVFERDQTPGGILPQCIHNGFGLRKFKEELTGPEYAHKYVTLAAREGVDLALDTTVLEIAPSKRLIAVSPRGGLREYRCRAIILAMGCRERPRGAIWIGGTRPAGVFTAGQVQRMVNIEGFMPGREVVILGSGDIGLIMARRMTLEGATVRAVVEILPYSSGLVRNVVQCLNDFNIPLLLSHTVTEIHGEYRVEAVSVAEVDGERNPVPGTQRIVPCDTLLLSAGLIPENELTRMAKVALDPATGGARVNDYFETSAKGIFSCGNVLHVNDIADNVSWEGEQAALAAGMRITGRMPRISRPIQIQGDETVGQVVPQMLSRNRTAVLHVRVRRPMKRARLILEGVLEKKLPYARPAEMIRFRVPRESLQPIQSRALRLRCEEG